MRDIVDLMDTIGFIHHKRSCYLIRKWAKIGFYNYGVSYLTGWLEYEKIPPRYIELIIGDFNISSTVKVNTIMLTQIQLTKIKGDKSK